MAHQKVERDMIEKQINVSGYQGSLGSNSEITQLKDSFSIFQKIAGSPKYWQVARNELIAKVNQLGPFHCFFTLSCAEMRWIEVYVCILKNLGISGLEIIHGKDGDWNGSDEEVLVIDDTLDKPLPIMDYLKEKKMCKNSTLMNYIVLITRIFDDRVKSFLKNIIMTSGEGEPQFRYYSYRIEFQGRGLPHVHGVLWLCIEWLKKFLSEQWKEMYDNDTNLKKSNWWKNKENDYEKGRIEFDLDNDIDRKMVVKLIDSFISCKIPTAQNDKVLNDYVPKLQKHKCTKTCFKKCKLNCRFGFPKLPSEKTLIAISIDEKFPELSKELKQKRLEKYTKILEKAKWLLTNKEKPLDPNTSYEEFYEKLEYSKKQYEEAISTTAKGKVIILERKVSEIWINNYSPLWLKSWNANLDVQFVIDQYAIITYVVSYVGKNEDGMTKFLIDVLKNTKDLPREDQLKALKIAWLTHRQIGASETVYRILPGLHLKDSNITCLFVASGFPENRSSFFRKVAEDNVENEFGEDSDDEDGEPNSKKIKIANRDGLFQQVVTPHDRYSVRPKSLENMCLAQWAVSYQSTSKVPKDTNFDNDNNSIDLSNLKLYSNADINLPKYIDLTNFNLGYMRARTFEAVLRVHKSSKKKESHEQFYAELQLYFPWRNETECLKRNDASECKNLYTTNFDTIIKINKEKLCPYESVIELSDDVEELTKKNKEDKPTHIYDMLASQMVQDEEEDEDEGIQDDPEFAARNPDGIVDEQTKSYNISESKYKHLVVPDDYDLLEMTRKLVTEQLQGLSKIIAYCKDVKRNFKNINHKVNPLRMIIQGGSGSGKSSLLRCASLHAEKILRKAGDPTSKPHVIICAPTGCAAKNVDGATLHSVFDFNFGNEHVPLKDKKLNIARDFLSDLKLLIIDEISMVKADLLYQLHMRLSEIFQDDDPFGGIATVLVGDLLQLKPIKGVYPFAEPRNSHFAAYYDVNPLWELHEVIDLRENHRQGDAYEWVEELNNIRKGNVTEKAEKFLRSRLIKGVEEERKANRLSRKRKWKKKPVLQEKGKTDDLTTTHIFYTNKEVNMHNTKMINTLEKPLIEICAKEPKGIKGKLKYGCIADTSFERDLKIKIGARVMLIFNISVVDGLVNGSLGHVVGIEKKGENVEFIIIHFDDHGSGSRQRATYPGLTAKYRAQNGTPIKRYKLDYQLTSKGGKKHAAKSWVEQFPIRLAWAITVHKIQGRHHPDQINWTSVRIALPDYLAQNMHI